MTNERTIELLEWFPKWTKQLKQAYDGGASQMFVLHGNVNDLLRIEKRSAVSYSMLPEFLATQVFGRYDAVLYFDQVRGPRALADTPARLEKINQHIERFVGSPEGLKATRKVAQAFELLDRYLELALLRDGERPSIAIILDYAHFMVPSTSVSNAARDLAPTLTTLLNWAKSPYFKRAPFAFCLISERMSDLHEALVRGAHTTKIEVPHPDRKTRLQFLNWIAGGRDFTGISEYSEEQLAKLTAGLTLVHLQGLMQRAMRTRQPIVSSDLKAYKKQMIEGQCQGLVEFVEPEHNLTYVVGHEAGKRRLKDDAALLEKGHLDALPMGYLLSGPVGTGKTFLAECYAGSVGIPCVKLLNFRSKYVGETEGNLEKILKVLRVMGPVAVIIDEADAMLGDRSSGSDSGTSGRVFGQFATQMGNTEYRGKIIWFLLTCRPDLLPIDIKRQGRCEVHIPLFYPEGEKEYQKMFVSMGRKNDIDIAEDEVPEFNTGFCLSGADIEGIALRAKRLALLSDTKEIGKEHLKTAIDKFIPSHQSEERELQELAAVMECTDLDFLTEAYRVKFLDPNGRAQFENRFRELKRSIGDE